MNKAGNALPLRKLLMDDAPGDLKTSDFICRNMQKNRRTGMQHGSYLC